MPLGPFRTLSHFNFSSAVAHLLTMAILLKCSAHSAQSPSPPYWARVGATVWPFRIRVADYASVSGHDLYEVQEIQTDKNRVYICVITSVRVRNPLQKVPLFMHCMHCMHLRRRRLHLLHMCYFLSTHNSE